MATSSLTRVWSKEGRRFVVVLPRAAASGAPGRSALPPVSQEIPSTLVGTDPETDLAVLK